MNAFSKLIEDIKNKIKEHEKNVAQECYLQCLVVECGEGECAEAIKSKFDL